jgi:aminopeptidase YwaD
MKKLILLIGILCATMYAQAQNLKYTMEVISTLASEDFHGRGYYEKGDYKAAEYIREEFKKVKLEAFGEYFQPFTLNINTFPGQMELKVDGKEMKAGKDFVMREYCSGRKGEFDVYTIDTANYNFEEILTDIEELGAENLFIACDFYFMYAHGSDMKELYKSNIAGLLLFWDRQPHWYVAYAHFTIPKTIIWLNQNVAEQPIKHLEMDIENVFVENYETQNVIGYIKGKEHKDSFIVFTAHYDHLGRLGHDVYYPGANDNASGIAMLLNLAEYFNKEENKADYSIAFMAFAAEEAGLHGSKYVVENPVFPNEKIRCVVNLDMIADLCDSITVQVNDEARKDFEIMNDINKEEKYINAFKVQGISPHSDHYSFDQANIPAMLFIMEGEIFDDYHTPLDTPDNIHLDVYKELYLLLRDYVNDLNK